MSGAVNGAETRPRPLIGLSTYREPARWGVWDQVADVLPRQYADAVAGCGGTPVLLPPVAADVAEVADVAASVVARLDALVITGGADVAPEQYDAARDPRTDARRADRDGWELALLDAAAPSRIPVLGVCRGMQVMAVHAGGRLEQHLPDRVGHDEHSPGGAVYGTVQVDTAPGSRVADLVGPVLSAQCHHHQAVATHPGYLATAHASDGTLEAMELASADGVDRFCVGVQWHPETIADVGLLAGLVAAASTYAAR